ncbi:MAG: recombinase RecA [Synechococcus sp. CPC35]|jgi:RecA/RadA recombinase|nr:recombinase RecA [Synechococcus sp. CPC35]|tara:strand:+ start:1175 stop:2236 length:1062 start_codon:yes stop_codon:yes gene_type:complete
MDLLKDLAKASGNELAGVVSDGIVAGDVDGYIDTGSYILNALVSGDIYRGIPSNKITALAGESATGKTFFALGMVQKFLDDNPEGNVVYFESESALTQEMLEDRGIDTSRILLVPVTTIEEFRTQAVNIIDGFDKQKKGDEKLFFVLDSLGMLSTIKETEDIGSGKNVRDMTKAQVIKGTFRVLTLKLGKVGIPMIVTNHTYDVIGSMFPQKEMGGGSGLKYAASSIIYLSKKKEKDGTEVIGNIIHCKNQKSRLTVENKMVDVRLTYDKGLDKHYGLLDLALKYGIFKQTSTRIELPNGTTQFGKTINNNPEKYFTEDILEQLNECAKKEFKYGKEEIQEVVDTETGEVIAE